MWSDNETSVDLLRFKYIATSVANVVRKSHLLPTTVGIYGDWGSGKSSLLKMIEADLKDQPGVLCLKFNGWLFEGYEDAKTALMGSILESIEDYAKDNASFTDTARATLEKLLKRVDLMQAASMAIRYVGPAVVGLPHLSALNAVQDLAKTTYDTFVVNGKENPPSLEELQKLFAKEQKAPENIRRDIRNFRKDFAALLEQAKIKTLVVFIDDLDRCLPDTIIETLEAIKLFLFVEGTVFILGADERLIQYAVRQRFPELPGTDTEVGRDYLEKLVQVPVRIPPLSGSDMESYMNVLFAALYLDESEFKLISESVAAFRPDNITDLAFDAAKARTLLSGVDSTILGKIEGDIDFTAQIAPVLAPILSGTPRRIKRFLNALLLRMQMGEARGLDLKRRVLTKLMLLEYLKEEFFQQLAHMQSAQNGRPEEFAKIEEVLCKPKEDAQVITTVPEDSDSSRAPQPVPEPARLTEADLPTEVRPWLADSWMREWLVSDPELASVDLRPYFTIAHDKTGALSGPALRLSPRANDVVNRLLDTSAATQHVGLARVADLSDADVSAVFQHLAKKLKESEQSESGPTSLHAMMLALAKAQPSLLPQTVTLYGSLPDTKISPGVIPRFAEAVEGSTSQAAGKEVMERWSTSSNSLLSGSAKQMLSRQRPTTRRQAN